MANRDFCPWMPSGALGAACGSRLVRDARRGGGLSHWAFAGPLALNSSAAVVMRQYRHRCAPLRPTAVLCGVGRGKLLLWQHLRACAPLSHKLSRAGGRARACGRVSRGAQGALTDLGEFTGVLVWALAR